MDDVILYTAGAVTVSSLGVVLFAYVARGARRLVLQRVGLYVFVPALTTSLIVLPTRLNLNISDGLSVAGLILTLLFAAGAGVLSRFSFKLRIGVVIPSRVPFHREVRSGFSEALAGVQFEMRDDYLATNQALENLSDFLPSLRRTLRWRPDYLVVCSPSVDLVSSDPVDGLLVDFARRGGGIIFIDNPPNDTVLKRLGGRHACVTSDVLLGAELLAAWVARQLAPGDEVLIIAGPSASAPARIRQAVLADAMPSARIEVADTGAWTAESAYVIARQHLSRGSAPRFVVCGNDVMALGAARAIREAKVEDRVSVAGYDGIQRALFAIAEPMNPLRATIRTPPSAYGHEIAAMICGEFRSMLPRSRLRNVTIPVSSGQLITETNVEMVLEG